MNTPSDALSERVHELVHPREVARPILSTTGTRAAIESLAARLETLEEAVREVAAVLEELAQSQGSSVR
ncbi:MAG TPA: hypothetical protein VNP89_03665 [Gaiellaceae bacterium]|nr:hypothetical protein [Gaiellaceae bacterium]